LRVEQLEDRLCPSGSYHVTDLGTLGGPGSFAYAINDYGQAVGSAGTGSQGDAFLWTPTAKNGTTGSIMDLGTLGGISTSTAPSSEAHAINAAGQVAGEAITASGLEHAFLWTPTTPNGTAGSMIDLGTLGGTGTTSVAYGINNAIGHPVQVVGESDTADGQHHPFIWTQGATDGVATNPQMKDLGALGGTSSKLNSASGINDAGQVTGTAWLGGDTIYHAFLWTPGGSNGVPSNPQMLDLGTLGGNGSGGRAINASGQVVGQSDTSKGEYHAFRWTPTSPNGTTGTMTDLGVLNNGRYTYKYSDAYGINDSGFVVGAAHPPDFTAFYWPSKGSLQDLNTLIPANSGFADLDHAYEINHAGQIVGSGRLPSGTIEHGFLLTPTGAKAMTAAALPTRAVPQELSMSQTLPILAEAIQPWQAAGVDTSGFNDNAGGWGWFVDWMQDPQTARKLRNSSRRHDTVPGGLANDGVIARPGFAERPAPEAQPV
jgi:probable HAF family extracellular repeat protein